MQKLLATICESKVAFVIIAGLNVVSFGYMMFMNNQLGTLISKLDEQPTNAACPDVRFGYTGDEIFDWMNLIGVNGRELYREMVVWDLFPYMEFYTLFFGSILVRQCQQSKGSSFVALIFPFMMSCDIVETGINLAALDMFPMRIDDRLMKLSSIGNQVKWISCVFGVFLILYNKISRKQKSA
jgi:hypothetical protein